MANNLIQYVYVSLRSIEILESYTRFKNKPTTMFTFYIGINTVQWQRSTLGH